MNQKHDELIIKIMLDFGLLKVHNSAECREKLERLLHDYEITLRSNLPVASDILEKVQYYLATKKLTGLAESTLKEYFYCLSRLSKNMYMPVASITTLDLKMYLSHFSQNIKKTTLATEIFKLKSFFGWLHAEEYIPKNPMIKIESPKIKKRLRKALSVEQMEILRDACVTLREKAILEFFYATGCRLSEVRNISINELNYNDLSVRVIGKGDKERTVYFTAKTKLHLMKYLSSRKDDNEALFVTSKNPIQRLGNRSLQEEIKRIAKRSGLEENIFPHLIRHTTATVMRDHGAEIATIQMILGHSDPATTQIYAETDDSFIQHEYRKRFVI